ncbi:hypothetical protein [Leptospira ilyithenensis]|uniref:Uncharacterized protein n=1 Tax=Leptospira ilyithenensis TaxID=2484901 RepID=A0A4V3JXI5_9LEPT|nr:hypothetical protein [Leptospira ilyithenensis]TGN14194.1 hypothetical protein EHS11_02520 [Leptospira ilyithenensis]
MRGGQQKIDKVSPLLKAREMFLFGDEGQGWPKFFRRNRKFREKEREASNAAQTKCESDKSVR